MVKVKICGVTTPEMGALAAEAGADYLGLNFYPPSSRYVEPSVARKIVEAAGDRVVPVGVFVDPDPDHVKTIAAESGIRIAQIHGDRKRHIAAFLEMPSLLAFSVRGEEVLEEIESLPADEVLLDAWRKGMAGGTGETFDWSIAAKVARARRVFLAGGLTPDNVYDAVLTVQPFAVDVASGVESAPGVKDEDKIRRFIAAAKSAVLKET